MRSIGLDIGEYSVKIVELVQNKKLIVINQLQEKVLSPDGSPQDKELEAIEFVRAFLSNGDYAQARWSMAVRQDQVTTRFKNFPFSDRIKIQKSLSFEMEEEIPFDADNCIFDAKVVNTQGSTSEVLASAVPKNHIQKLIDLADNFGIELQLISIEGLAFANLVEDWEHVPPNLPKIDLELNEAEKPLKHVQVLLNMGHKKTLFTAYENNRLIFVRSLYWGADQLIQEIIKKQEITRIEATRTLQTQGVLLLNKQGASFEQAQISNTLSKSLRELVRDLQMTLLELKSELNAEIVQINFTGGLSLLQNLGGFLTQHLEVACNPVSLLQNYSTSIAPFTTPENQFAVETRFATAVSLAIEGFKRPRNPPTNLLKGEFAKQNNQFKILWMQWGRVAQIGAAALFVLFMWTIFRDNFSLTLVEKGDEALSTQARKMANLPKKQANESGVKKYIKQNKKKAADLKLVAQVAQMNSALEILKKVSESSPQKEQVKIDLMSFQVRDDLVQMLGYANSPKDVNLLTQNLKTLAIDGVVNQGKANLGSVPNRVAFNISFKADRGLVK
ncbi:MAG: pilus assembly protein PilM [Bdellovibrionaceae bacterium]|nr:pilus assembly protein PilM [Bdellovibrio sp.]